MTSPIVRLQHIARAAMLERGLEPEFPDAARSEADRAHAAAANGSADVRDLRQLLWCSIDNDDSKDLDQLTVAEQGAGGTAIIRIAVADVAEVVKKNSALDAHAALNTTSVYTEGEIFPMLPPRLSTDLTSLNPGEDRLSIIVEAVVDAAGSGETGSVYRGVVRNHVQLTYHEVRQWLEQAT